MTDKIVYAVEPFSDALLCEFLPLLQEHYRELWKHPDIPLSPDLQRYYFFANNGMLHIVTARQDGELIGYAVNIMMKGLHYSTAGFASNDLVFVSKSHRKGLVGIRLLRFMEEKLKEAGVHFIQMHVKPEPDFSPVLKKSGYELFETIYMKRVR